MPYADIKLGYSCNNNCIHCVIADNRDHVLKINRKQDLTTDEFKKDLYDARNRGINHVVFTGGEPTIRKDLFNLIVYAKSLGFSMSMQTNGRMFYYPDFSKRLSGFSIKFVIALHGPNAELHDSITQVKGSFNQTMEGIKNLINLGEHVCGKIVISKKNYKYLDDIIKLFIDFGVKIFFVAFPHGQGNARKYFDDVVPKYSEIKGYVHNTISFVEAYNKKNSDKLDIDFEAIPLCFMKGYEKYVCELSFKDRLYSELKQVGGRVINWDVIRKKIKSKSDGCKKCLYDNICEGPWEEYVKEYGDKEFVPVTSL